ncbi:MAG: OmpA family protein [Candidatus Brocadiales bacterium]
MRRKKTFCGICVITIVLALLLAPSIARAQAGSEEDAVYHVGSGLLSLLYFPIKLTMCVGTQAVTAVAYVSTYQVPGNFEGGTNGKEIGEVARGACGGPWLVSFGQVKEDYQPQVGLEKASSFAKAPLQEPTIESATPRKVPAEKIVVKEVIKDVPKVVAVENVFFPDVAFRFDSAELSELGKGKIYLAAQKIKAKSDVLVIIGGHTDYIGSDDYNQKLGLRRAATVKLELVHLGINPANMSVESFGESRPVFDQRTHWARAINRRVEIKVKGE